MPSISKLNLDPDRIGLSIDANRAGELFELEQSSWRRGSARPTCPYAWLLRNLLHGIATLSIRDDEVEESWRIVEPILESRASGDVPLQDYPAGSDGPPRLARTP